MEQESMSEERSEISIGKGLTILANAGLLIGLIFVWVELRQNQTQLKAEVELSLASGYQTVLGRGVENPALLDTIGTAYFEPESLTPTQYSQLTFYHAEWMTLVFATYQLWHAGAIEDDVWEQHSRYYLTFLLTPWMQDFWRGLNHDGVYPPRFIEELEARLPEPQTFSMPDQQP
jgi:membrane associated rhomboid family serine protease